MTQNWVVKLLSCMNYHRYSVIKVRPLMDFHIYYWLTDCGIIKSFYLTFDLDIQHKSSHFVLISAINYINLFNLWLNFSHKNSYAFNLMSKLRKISTTRNSYFFSIFLMNIYGENEQERLIAFWGSNFKVHVKWKSRMKR